jgi:PST family polysaccharide transporter
LIKGMTSLAMPFLAAVFPVFSRHLEAGGGPASFRAPLAVLAAIGALALAGAGLGAWLGPWVLDALLGTGFGGSLAIYYVLIGLVPLRIVNQSIAMVLLIPAGRAKPVSYVISAFSVLAVVCGTGLSFPYGGLGMAVGLVGAEAALLAVMLAMTAALLRQGAEGVE